MKLKLSLKERLVQERERRKLLRDALQREPVSLTEFIERTSNLILDPWQQDMCRRLEAFRTERGLRVAICAPPQHGKSILVSQRMPAWILGHSPLERIKVASYNVTHAAKFGRSIRDLMQSQEYAMIFPVPDSRLPKVCSGEVFSTEKRAALRDAQPSFKALGLQSGFIGEGVDCLVVDDPYSSPEDAYSEVINDRTYQFWTDTAKPRLNETTNVLLMFHRYVENDLAGKMLAEGGWTLLRYAAIADGPYELPETGEVWEDPMGREEGDKLSPRFSFDFYEKQQQNPFIWLSQFQGRPTGREGTTFQVEKIQVIDRAPLEGKRCRAWDLAGTVKGDPTAGVRVMKDSKGHFIVEHVERGRWAPGDRDKVMQRVAASDGRGVKIFLPQDPGQAGIDQVRMIVSMLAGYTIRTAPVRGDKITRAEPFATQVNIGNVSMVKGPWNHLFKEELRQFPRGAYDDQVDAGGDAFKQVAFGQTAEVVDFHI